MKIKVSWRTYADPMPFDTLPRSQEFFALNDSFEGKSPKDFIVQLIRSSPAVAVAVNNKLIWKTGNYEDPVALAMRGLLGEPRQAAELIEIDYNKQGDWIETECRFCGWLDGIHTAICANKKVVADNWIRMLNV